MLPSDDEEEEFFGEVATVVDAVVELSEAAVTRQAHGLCGWCGAEGCQPRGKCPSCGKIPAVAEEECLGCEGPVLWLPPLVNAVPATYEDGERVSRAGGGGPRCLACPTWWLCVVMRELEA